ncbi:MAG: transcriptional repressor LexA [Alphaproteobacteria bacterium]|nr:transcriptional repressor LexA [Alphaproteobacteria bacterium]
MLTPRQYNLLLFINKSIKENGCCPSFEEMKEAVGLKSKSGVHSLLESLIERNFIRKLPHKARALEIVRLPKLKPSAIIEEERKKEEALQNAAAQIPLYGKIAAGTPIEAIANELEVVSVPFEMVERGLYYALTIEGDSMIEGGIMDGDTVIIKKAQTARNGETVVALVDDAEATLKIFKQEGDEISLIPQNREYETRKLHASRVKVQGTLSGLLRRYN